MVSDSISIKYLGIKGRTSLLHYFFHLHNLIFLLFVLELVAFLLSCVQSSKRN